MACFLQNAVAQQNIPDNILKKFASLKSYAPDENVTVITDRDNYVASDIIWFDIYNLYTGDTLSNLSKVGYVEVLDNNNQPVLQAKTALEHGKGHGSFMVPENLKTGYYVLRGYTNWMKNYSPQFYFQKHILINNVFNNEALSADTKAEPVIHFYVEGNNLVSGVPANLAIVVSDSAGIPMKFSGVLTGSKSDTLTNINSDADDVASLNFTPINNENYYVAFTLNDGRKLTKPLPQVLQYGTVLQVHDSSNNKIALTIHAVNNNEAYYLMIHDKKSIKFYQQVELTNGIATMLFDKNNLNDGLNNVSLLNVDGRSVNERLYFISKSQPNISVSTNKNLYSKREKVQLNIDLKNDKNDIPLTISVSVYRSNKVFSGYNTNLLDGLYNGLFLNNNSANALNSDVVNTKLLTYKWNAFNWNNTDYLKPGLIKYLPEYEGHIVSAIITDAKTKLPLSNTIGYLSVPGKAFQFYTSRSNEDGLIHFFTKDFYGDNLIIAQGERSENDAAAINILSPFSQDVMAGKNPSYSTTAVRPGDDQVEQGINVQLQKKFAYSRIVPAPIKYDSIPFFGKETIKYELDDYVRFPTMEEVLREYVRELNVRKRKDEFALSMVIKNENSVAIIKHPAIFIDGVPAFDTGNKVTHYDPLKIKTIKIVTDRYHYGPATFDGIASFTTYKGNLEGYTPDPNATVIDYAGLQADTKFYSPVYQTPEQLTSRMPDFRELLYWSDNILVSSEGRGSGEFYTSDQTGTYIVEVTMLKNDGKLEQSTKSITVQ